MMLFESEKKTDYIKSHMPINLLSTLFKVFEKFLRKLSVVKDRKFIPKQQFGFQNRQIDIVNEL